MSKLNAKANYRALLNRELEKRCDRNPRYSLRSFSRDLAISPSRLSDVLRGRYGLSRKAAEDIGWKLGWSSEEREYFCDLVDSEHARSSVRRSEALARLQKHHHSFESQKLSLDAFQIISDWHHYAILELCLTKEFQSNIVWIAKRLGIHEQSVDAALERLLRLGLLENVEGTLRASTSFTASPSDVPSAAIRKFHRQVLQKAMDAMELQAVSERDFSSIVLAVNKKHLPEAKAAIRNFRREFDQQFGQSEEKDDVYCLNVQFFSLLEKTNSIFRSNHRGPL